MKNKCEALNYQSQASLTSFLISVFASSIIGPRAATAVQVIECMTTEAAQSTTS